REEPASDRITRAASLLREEVLAEIQEEQETFKARLEAELEQVKNELVIKTSESEAYKEDISNCEAIIEKQKIENSVLREKRDELNHALLVSEEKIALLRAECVKQEARH